LGGLFGFFLRITGKKRDQGEETCNKEGNAVSNYGGSYRGFLYVPEKSHKMSGLGEFLQEL